METNSSLAVSQPVQGSKKTARRANRAEKLALFLCLAVVLYLVLPPLFTMLWISLHPENAGASAAITFQAYSEIFKSAKLWELIKNTLVFAAGSTAGGVLLGTIMAWLVVRTDAPFKKLAYATTFIGFAVPGMLKVIGWVLLFGENNGLVNNLFKAVFGEGFHFNIQSMGGMIFVESLMWTPMVFMLMVGPLRSMDPSLEESAAISGASPWFVYRKITLRLLFPSLLSVLILMLIRSIQAFEVPLFLGSPKGIQVITSYIYSDLHESFVRDYAKASAYGSMLVFLLILVLYLYYRVTQQASRFQTVTGKGFRPRLYRLGKWRWLGASYLITIFTFMILPICYVVYASLVPTLAASDQPFWLRLGFGNYKEMFSYSGVIPSIFNSLFIALITATVAVLIAAFASWIIVRSKVQSRWMLDQAIGIPLVYPGVVLSLAVLLFYLHSPIPLYGTVWIIVIAYITHFSPYAMRYTQPAFLQVHADLEDSAKTCGAHWWIVFRKILMPILMPSFVGAWIFIFFTSIRELSIAALLYTAHTPVIATQILDMWTNGNLSVLSAFGSFITIISVIMAAIVFRYARRFGVSVK